MKKSYVYFVCSNCGKQKVEYETFKNKCACGEQIYRYTITSDNSPPAERCNIDALDAEHPRLSYSMAISPERLSEAMRLWPDSKYVPNKTGDMLLLEVRSRKDKLKKMRERNLIELD